MNERVTGKTILVTGANRGIGLEMSRQLSLANNSVIAVCRSASKDLAELDVEVIENVDVGTGEGVATLARQVGDRKIDWLVNNAGVLATDSLDGLDFEAIEYQFRVNTMGPLRVSAALLGNLQQGSKIFVITSAMGSITDNTSGGYYGYRISKAGVNMAFKSLSVDLQGRGIGVFMLHPGWVATDMSNFKGPVSPEASVNGLVARMVELEPEMTGTFRHARGHDLNW
ncbi:MAG TPA: SDR family oxidoreductase [Xanthomonadales bacterium]|nr:SDR family oxidoreductase [Xanthomonadales bacterium]